MAYALVGDISAVSQGMKEGMKGGIVMGRFATGRLIVSVLCVLAVIGATTCLADEGVIDAGDPGNISPGMNTLEPTPAILSVFVTVLVTVVSLALS
jgi:hypothetical protein